MERAIRPMERDGRPFPTIIGAEFSDAVGDGDGVQSVPVFRAVVQGHDQTEQFGCR